MLDGIELTIAIISSVMGYLLGSEDIPLFAFLDSAIIASIEHISLRYKHLGKSSS
jgi:hypothetical protein